MHTHITYSVTNVYVCVVVYCKAGKHPEFSGSNPELIWQQGKMMNDRKIVREAIWTMQGESLSKGL